MIKRILLENWRSHARSELVFSNGTNVLVGRMGSGKSSVMDAISFALFGTFPNVQSRKVKLEDYIMNKPSIRQKAKVELELEINGKAYKVTREITRGKGTSKAELLEEGKLKEAVISQVNESLSRIIGMNYDLFSKAIYSEQNQIDYFLQIPAGKRKQKIDELLGIDKFEDARKNLVSAVNRIKDRIRDRKDEMENIKIDEMLKNINNISSEISELENGINKIREGITKLGESVKVAKSSVDRLEKIRSEREEVNKKIENLKGKLVWTEKREKEIEEKLGDKLNADMDLELKGERDQLESLKRDLEKIEAELDSISKRKADINAKVRMNEERIKRKETLQKTIGEKKINLVDKRELEGKLVEVNNEIDKYEKRMTELKATAEKLKERQTSLSKASGRCPVCDSKLPDDKKERLILDAKASIETTNVEIRKVEKLLSEDKAKRDEINRKMRELEVTEREIANLENELNSLTIEDIEKMKGELSDLDMTERKNVERRNQLKTGLDKLVQTVSKLEMLAEMKKEYQSLVTNKGEILSSIKSFENELAKLPFDENEYNRLKNEYVKLSSELSSKKTELTGKLHLVEEKKKLLKELNEKIEWRKKLEGEVITLESTWKSLRQLSTALETSQLKLREEFVDTVNAALADIWPRVYPYGDYQSLRLNVGEKDYVLELQRNDERWVNVEGVASGGERSAAALALRVAFALVLTQKLSWLILDEPTHNLDKDGVKALAVTLKEHLPGLVEQIFIITHDEEMERAVSGTLYRFERDKTANEPTQVTLISSGSE